MPLSSYLLHDLVLKSTCCEEVTKRLNIHIYSDPLWSRENIGRPMRSVYDTLNVALSVASLGLRIHPSMSQSRTRAKMPAPVNTITGDYFTMAESIVQHYVY